MSSTRLRAGIVGGGKGSFIGAVHRMAVELDGQARVIAGALSSDPDRARASARDWGLERSYSTYTEMALQEAKLPDGIDFVIVATPNDLHYPVSKAFIEAGIPVVCEKPLAHQMDDAQALAQLLDERRGFFALTHNYTGYPAIREARARVESGALGDIRRVAVQYLQDWLMEPLELSGNKQAEWRTDPSRAGPAGAVGDIGTHAQNLVEFVTGLRVMEVCADLSSFVAGRPVDDDANVLMRLERGAKGTLTCSQIACGKENDLSLAVYGSKGGLEWHQEEPNTLWYAHVGEPAYRLRVARAGLSEAARQATRLPAGHPEGYLEAFAVLYRDIIADLRRRSCGQAVVGGYPGVREGIRGMRFVTQVLESARQGSCWRAL